MSRTSVSSNHAIAAQTKSRRLFVTGREKNVGLFALCATLCARRLHHLLKWQSMLQDSCHLILIKGFVSLSVKPKYVLMNKNNCYIIFNWLFFILCYSTLGSILRRCFLLLPYNFYSLPRQLEIKKSPSENATLSKKGHPSTSLH